MSTTLTIRLDKKLDAELTRLAKTLHRPKSALVREFIRQQLALAKFERARTLIEPAAEQAGFLTDEDVFREVS
ncbi:CopG family ribbon-helix-helix protein [Pelomicrobium methylotrophicum]|jgi:predicted transcriptional regulator|uniref:Ribbon-helix-helix protein, CopG family n=1 Tax=Pelomicrobium methylotrophicum TaxID=2602750 RepID=A0A5C7EHG0_9PROT|nr:ribbon-helix-helix protein, CopG family [Pelomicrobium methylotrophicum]TXF11476.1 ribbon-helix-helix protein, CopG family [Pelomicrobium methylotrophicum]